MDLSAVFFDRDGIINKTILKEGKPYPPYSLDELEFYPETIQLINYLNNKNIPCFVLTNQPDVARGIVTKDWVETIFSKLRESMPVKQIYCCYHDDLDNCQCRKPKPGLFFQARDEFALDLNKSFFIGDRWRDVEAGYEAGVKTIWIDREYSEKPPSVDPFLKYASTKEVLKYFQDLLGKA